jgi:hypothetical protein
MAQGQIVLKSVFGLSSKGNVSEAQVRLALGTFESWSDPYVDGIAAANGVTITGREYRLEVDLHAVIGGRRHWTVYPKVVLSLSGDGDDHPYYDPYWAEFQVQVAAFIAAAPPGREFVIEAFSDPTAP